MKMLVFEVEGTRYAVALDTVHEVVRAVAVTPLPEAPAVVAGIINVRGSAVPVYDLRARFGAPQRALDPGERFIVARTVSRTVALRVDAVDWIHAVDADEVQEVAGLVRTAGYVTGVARLPDGLLLIHDLESFLSAAEAGEMERSIAAYSAAGDA